MNHNKVLNQTANLLLSDLIRKGKFHEAGQLLSNYHTNDIRNMLLDLLPQHGIMVYTFANFMLQYRESAFWHRMSALLIRKFDVPYSKNAAVYHLKKSVQLDPADWLAKEKLLQYYDEGLISSDEAYMYAKHVLIHNPMNRAAKRVIGISV